MYERIDVSMVYEHVIWSYVFCIYLIIASMGLYVIWTELKFKFEFLTIVLMSIWAGFCCALIFLDRILGI